MTRSLPETAAAQLRRLLQIIPQIADGEEHPIEQVVHAVGASDDKQLIADLQSLVDRLDTPGAFVDGVQVWIDGRNMSVVSSHFLRPMRLTTAELCALEIGIAILRTERPPSEHAVLDHALTRLRGVITQLNESAAREGIRTASLGADGDTQHLAELRRSLAAHHMIRILYRGGAATEATWRSIRPYGLVFANGVLYAIAHCMERDGVRSFRLDRIEATQSTDESYTLPPEFTLATAADGIRVLSGAPSSTMCVRYSARVAPWIAEREGIAVEADGTLVMQHPVHDPAWALRHVLQYGPDAEVLSPPEIRAMIAARLDEMDAAG